MALTRRQVVCPGCRSRWPRATTRFCGRCGCPVRPARAGGTHTPVPGWRHRLVMVASAGALLAAAVAWSTGGTDSLPQLALLDPAAATAVSLPSGPAPTPQAPQAAGTRLGAAAAGGLRATNASRTTPGDLRCLPDGCVRWARELDPAGNAVHVTGDLVLLVEPGRAEALDAISGARRWTVDLTGLIAVAGDGTPITGPEGALRLVVERAGPEVVLAAPGTVLLIDAEDGSERWRRTPTGWDVWAVSVTTDRVVLTASISLGGSPNPRIVVLDRATGDIVWDRVAQRLVWVTDDIVVLRPADGQLLGLDARTGELRWERREPPDAPVTAAHPWLLADGVSGHRLLDPRDGQVLAELDGFLAHDLLPVAGDAAGPPGVVSVLLPPEPPPTRRRADPVPQLVRLDLDGSVRWRRPYAIGAPWRCCAGILHLEDGVVVAGRDGEVAAYDLADGTPRTPPRLPRFSGPVTADGPRVAGADPAGVDGDPALTVRDADDRRLYLSGPGLELLHLEPLVVRTTTAVAGLHVGPRDYPGGR